MEKFREQLLSRREQMRKKREMEEKAKLTHDNAQNKSWQNKPQQQQFSPQKPPPLMQIMVSDDFKIKNNSNLYLSGREKEPGCKSFCRQLGQGSACRG